MSLAIIRVVPNDDWGAVLLERRMQAEYIEMYGESDQDPDNTMAGAVETLLATAEGRPVGIGAWGLWPDGAGKVRLLYTVPEARGQRVAAKLLSELQHRMREQAGCDYVKFETGPKQTAAQRLYEVMGYSRLSEGFGFYAGNPGSVFFGKSLP